jgi:hypothetical protein
MSQRIGIEGDWEVVEKVLPPGWREAAVKCGAIIAPAKGKTKSRGKLTDAALVLRLVLFHAAAGVSLKVTCAAAAAANLVSVSAVSLHHCMRRCGRYLAFLLSEMTQTRALFAAERWAGYEMVVVDATTVLRPGAKGTTARVHHELRLADLSLVRIIVTDEHGGETFRNFAFRPGQLAIGDRGYANPPGIAAVVDAEADVLVRYNFGSLPLYDAQGGLSDIERKLAHLSKPGQVHEWTVYVRPRDHRPIRGRLIAVRLPADKAAESRERLRQEQGNDLSERALRTADFVVLFSTVPKNRLTAAQLMQLYGLRWQVELRIKRDKSIGELDRLPNLRPDTIYSWICAKLLAQQIAHRLSTPDVALFPCAIAKAAFPATAA